MTFPKRSGFGFAERLLLLESHFGDGFANLRASVPTRDVADDDLLDAAAALWTAERIKVGAAVRLPERLVRDRFQLPMSIVA